MCRYLDIYIDLYMHMHIRECACSRLTTYTAWKLVSSICTENWGSRKTTHFNLKDAFSLPCMHETRVLLRMEDTGFQYTRADRYIYIYIYTDRARSIHMIQIRACTYT